jgi:TetR/AcrR family transcriptional regulator, mexJK operon transcriptional repressor
MGRPSAESSREKMDHVLQVARREFVNNGYRATRMDDIAAAADVAKRTLYLWHKDKAGLFLACVLEGARRFPSLSIDAQEGLNSALKAYATALVRELASKFSYGMGLLIIRETAEFPELAAASKDAYSRYVIEPLAAYLRRRGLEDAGSTERTELLLSMILTGVHRALLNGDPPPDSATAEDRARLAVDVFLLGARPTATDADR